MQNAEKFSSTLRELRGKKGLSQQQLAERMIVSRSAVSMWELGSRLPVEARRKKQDSAVFTQKSI